MTLEQLSSILLASGIAVTSILFQVYLWQRKEYRWDRLRSYLFSPENPARRDPLLWVSLILIGFGVGTYLSGLYEITAGVSWSALLLLAARVIFRTLRSGLYRPDITTKSGVALVLATLFSVVTLFFVIGYTQVLVLELVAILFLLPLPIALAVGLTRALGGIQKYVVIKKARALRASMTDLTVVAITGSVGKTSTKEYLVHILQKAGHNVRATKEHRNSEFTVAQDMLEQLPEKPDTYIAEAAAYRAGEVGRIVTLTSPQTGVLTAITNQHEGLFGSVQEIQKAKWEIVQNLPEDGTAVLNGDVEYIQSQSKSLKKKKVLFSSKSPLDVYATDIVVAPDSISFQLHVSGKTDTVTAPLVSTGSLQSLLAAITAASVHDVSLSDIVNAIQDLPVLPRTMEMYTSNSGVTVIDDSYSGSEASVVNAVTHLATFAESNKHIVLVPLIELGQSAQEVHRRIGEVLAASGANVYIYGTAYQVDIIEGAKNSIDAIQWFEDAEKMKEYIASHVAASDVVLLEGRIPDTVRQVFKKHS